MRRASRSCVGQTNAKIKKTNEDLATSSEDESSNSQSESDNTVAPNRSRDHRRMAVSSSPPRNRGRNTLKEAPSPRTNIPGPKRSRSEDSGEVEFSDGPATEEDEFDQHQLDAGLAASRALLGEGGGGSGCGSSNQAPVRKISKKRKVIEESDATDIDDHREDDDDEEEESCSGGYASDTEDLGVVGMDVSIAEEGSGRQESPTAGRQEQQKTSPDKVDTAEEGSEESGSDDDATFTSEPPTAAWRAPTSRDPRYKLTVDYPEKGGSVLVRSGFPPNLNITDNPTEVETPQEHSATAPAIRTNEQVLNTLRSALVAIPGLRSLLFGAVEALRSTDIQYEFRTRHPKLCMVMDDYFGEDQSLVVLQLVKAAIDSDHDRMKSSIEVKLAFNGKAKKMGSDLRIEHLCLSLERMLNLLPQEGMDIPGCFALNLNILLDVTLRRTPPNSNCTSNISIGRTSDLRDLRLSSGSWLGNALAVFTELWSTVRPHGKGGHKKKAGMKKEILLPIDGICLMNALWACLGVLVTRGANSSNAQQKVNAEVDDEEKESTIKTGRAFNLSVSGEMMVVKGALPLLGEMLLNDDIGADVKAVIGKDMEHIRYRVLECFIGRSNNTKNQAAALNMTTSDFMKEHVSIHRRPPLYLPAGQSRTETGMNPEYLHARRELLKQAKLMVGTVKCDFLAKFANGVTLKARTLEKSGRKRNDVMPPHCTFGDTVAFTGEYEHKECSVGKLWKKIYETEAGSGIYMFADKKTVAVHHEQHPRKKQLAAWRTAETKPTEDPSVRGVKWEDWARVDGVWREMRQYPEVGDLQEGCQRGDVVAYMGRIRGKDVDRHVSKPIKCVEGDVWEVIDRSA